jgi:hypothetical protein
MMAKNQADPNPKEDRRKPVSASNGKTKQSSSLEKH